MITKNIWSGYEFNESTWEPENGLVNIWNLFRKFEKKRKTVKSNIRLKKRRESSKLDISETLFQKKQNKQVRIKVFEPNLLDYPLSIIGLKNKNNFKIKYLIKWQVRENGVTTECSFVDSDFLRKNFKEILINFLESRIMVSKDLRSKR